MSKPQHNQVAQLGELSGQLERLTDVAHVLLAAQRVETATAHKNAPYRA